MPHLSKCMTLLLFNYQSDRFYKNKSNLKIRSLRHILCKSDSSYFYGFLHFFYYYYKQNSQLYLLLNFWRPYLIIFFICLHKKTDLNQGKDKSQYDIFMLIQTSYNFAYNILLGEMKQSVTAEFNNDKIIQAKFKGSPFCCPSYGALFMHIIFLRYSPTA